VRAQTSVLIPLFEKVVLALVGSVAMNGTVSKPFAFQFLSLFY